MPEALRFIERLAGCISPTIERTKAQVLGEKLEMATKLVFVPASEREHDQPLDLHQEVFVSHRGVFLDIGQFSVYVARFSPSSAHCPGATGASCLTRTRPRRLPRTSSSSASPNGPTLHPSNPTMSPRRLATTRRFAYHVGQTGWDQGYRYTWYWNQQCGWYWRWT